VGPAQSRRHLRLQPEIAEQDLPQGRFLGGRPGEELDVPAPAAETRDDLVHVGEGTLPLDKPFKAEIADPALHAHWPFTREKVEAIAATRSFVRARTSPHCSIANARPSRFSPRRPTANRPMRLRTSRLSRA